MLKITLRMAREMSGYSVEEVAGVLGILPDILTAQNISDYLQISRRRTYELLQLPSEKGGIKNFSVGTSRRVKRMDFEEWIEQQRSIVANL